MNLLAYWNEGINHIIPERKKELTKSFIENNLRINRQSRFSFYYNDQVKATLKLYGEFSINFRRAIKDDNLSEAIYLLNNTYSEVRSSHRTCWVDILEEKFSGANIRQCNDCGELIDAENDDYSYAYDDYVICPTCRDECYSYSDNRDCYISNDDYENEERDEDSEYINEYHSSELGHIPSEFDKRKTKVYLGMELEVEVKDGDRSGKAQEVSSAISGYRSPIDDNYYDYSTLEHDGSLDYGFEIITGYTGLDVHRDQLKFFKNRWHGVKSHDTNTCGLHVHICKSDMTMYHASKLILFINDPDNHRLIKSIARRDESGYAKIKNKAEDKRWITHAKQFDNPLNHLNEDRYEALNFKNPKTIEFRLFKGTLKYETIISCLEFTYASWFFARDTGATDLTIPKFLDFICKPENRADTIYLRSYLASKGFDLPKLGLVRTNPRNEVPAEVAEV
jgi:hypothetical protein